MGSSSSSSEPKITAPVLQDKFVKRDETITFSWEANCNVSAEWTKDNLKLENGGRICITQPDKKSSKLMITYAKEEDEGEYKLILSNSNHSASGVANVKVMEFDKEWRKINLEETYNVRTFLKDEFKLANLKLKQLRFLLHGPIGAGKSSLINSINSTFLGRSNIIAPTAPKFGTTFTKVMKTYVIEYDEEKQMPFAFIDIMGMENREDGGVKVEDLISILEGHVKEGYEFNPASLLRIENKSNYISNPTLNDKVHCLVSVIAADKIFDIAKSDEIIRNMKRLREAARDLGIPQVVFMTHVDLCCPVVKDDLTHIYSSKKIKLAMEHCCDKLGVSMNGIFPLKNYHEEKDVNMETDCLIMDAMKQIAYFANDYVKHYEGDV